MAYLDPLDPRAPTAVCIQSPTGATLHRSRNLRALIEHARRDAPLHVTITPDRAPYGGAAVRVVFTSGAYCATGFASAQVCTNFFTARAKRAPAWRDCLIFTTTTTTTE